MSKTERPTDKVTGTVEQAERGENAMRGSGDRNVGGREGGTPPPPPPSPELPLDDDGDDARNIGG